MPNQANVQQIEEIRNSISLLHSVDEETDSGRNQAEKKAEQLSEESREEQIRSHDLLEKAKSAEEVAHALLIVADIAVAEAAAEVAASAANPLALAAALAKLEEARRRQQEAKRLYDLAVKHRELMERRCEIVDKCVSLSEIAENNLKAILGLNTTRNKGLLLEGNKRLSACIIKLEGYESTIAPDVNDRKPVSNNLHSDNDNNNPNENKQRDGEKVKENKVLKPPDILRRLNISPEERIQLLQKLYISNPDFALNVNRYRIMPREAGETQIRRNMAGRLAEEMVIQAFSPYGNVSTQGRIYVAKDKYTKIDLMVTNLKLPVILGRGPGMMAPKGGSLAIEVKAGQSAYIQSQQEHMLFQVQGHITADASCIICTRDIKGIEDESQNDLRQEIAEAGSRILGMLPTKDELDATCLEFVYGKETMT